MTTVEDTTTILHPDADQARHLDVDQVLHPDVDLARHHPIEILLETVTSTVDTVLRQ
jgi:hypothetical protein